MKSNQENKFTMEDALLGFLSQNTALVTTIPDLGSLISGFSDNLGKIRVIREQLAADKTGITEDKGQIKKDLVVKALDISRKTIAFARMNNNLVLLKEVYFPESELRRSPDHVLIDRVMLIYDKANDHLEALGKYGVTTGFLAAFKSAIDQFGTSIPRRRLGVTEKKEMRALLDDLFAANDDLLQKMDALVGVVRLSQPMFYASYRNNRKVVDTRRSTVALKATVKDAVTNTGIKGVKVSFAPQNGQLRVTATKSDLLLVKRTAKKGSFLVKSLNSGMYTATIEKNGFKEQTVTVAVVEGERTNLIVELERN